MNKNCENKITAHSQNILHVDALYNIKRKKYKTVCTELTFAKVVFDRMVIKKNYRTCNVFFICCAVGLLQHSKCLIKSRNSHCLYAMLISCILIIILLSNKHPYMFVTKF